MFHELPQVVFALQVIAVMLLLIFMSMVGFGFVLAPSLLVRLDSLISVLKEIAEKMPPR
jgi:hypothetical protein